MKVISFSWLLVRLFSLSFSPQQFYPGVHRCVVLFLLILLLILKPAWSMTFYLFFFFFSVLETAQPSSSMPLNTFCFCNWLFRCYNLRLAISCRSCPSCPSSPIFIVFAYHASFWIFFHNSLYFANFIFSYVKSIIESICWLFNLHNCIFQFWNFHFIVSFYFFAKIFSLVFFCESWIAKLDHIWPVSCMTCELRMVKKKRWKKSVVQGLYMACKSLKYILFGTLKKMFANPWCIYLLRLVTLDSDNSIIWKFFVTFFLEFIISLSFHQCHLVF